MLTVGLNTKEASLSLSLKRIWKKKEPTKDNTTLGRLFLHACTCKCMWSANDRVYDSFLEREKWNGKSCNEEHRFSFFVPVLAFSTLLINSYFVVSLSLTAPFCLVFVFVTFYLTAQVFWSRGIYIGFCCKHVCIASHLKNMCSY